MYLCYIIFLKSTYFQFNEIVTILIALLGLIISVISLNEVIKQRVYNSKPYLLIEEKEKIYFSSIDNKLKFYESENSEKGVENIEFNIINAGLGNSIDISVKFIFNITDFVETINNFNFINSNYKYYAEFSDKEDSIKIFQKFDNQNKILKSIETKEHNKKFLIIEPNYIGSKMKTTITLPRFYIEILSFYYSLMLNNRVYYLDYDANFYFIICYKDVNQKSYYNRINFIVNLSNISDNESIIDGVIDFEINVNRSQVSKKFLSNNLY